MKYEKEKKPLTYEKASAEVVYFDNSDVVMTSGCQTWSNQNGKACYFGLTEA